MSKRALGWALGLALLTGLSGPASADKLRMNYECTCICVATDKSGNRVEGTEKFTFQTAGSDCSVAQKTGCYVADTRGTWASCSGKDINSPPAPAGEPAAKD